MENKESVVLTQDNPEEQELKNSLETLKHEQLEKLKTLSRIQLFDCDSFGAKLVTENFATILRDKMYNLPFEYRRKAIASMQSSRKCIIPKEHHGGVILMTEYNQYNRFKCCVEQAMLENVIGTMVRELIDEEGC